METAVKPTPVRVPVVAVTGLGGVPGGLKAREEEGFLDPVAVPVVVEVPGGGGHVRVIVVAVERALQAVPIEIQSRGKIAIGDQRTAGKENCAQGKHTNRGQPYHGPQTTAQFTPANPA